MDTIQISVLAPVIGKKVKVSSKDYENGGYEGTVIGITIYSLFVEHPNGSQIPEAFGKCTLLDEEHVGNVYGDDHYATPHS